MTWIPLESENQLNEILAHNGKSMIFKHSTRCSISTMAKKTFEADYTDNEAINAYFLDLIKYRSISNLIAEKTGVMHESPQVLVIENGINVYSATHEDINAEDIMALA